MSVRRQCELLQVNRSSVYYETKEPTETQRLLKEEIMARIDYWHTELPAMGSRKIAAKLRDEGYKVGRKLVRAYMREMEIYAIYEKHLPLFKYPNCSMIFSRILRVASSVTLILIDSFVLIL